MRIPGLYIPYIAALTLALTASVCKAQSLTDGMQLQAEVCGTASSGANSPFWLHSNRQGLISTVANSAFERISFSRELAADSLRNWHRAFTLDVAVRQNSPSVFLIHQAYFEAQYKKLHLIAGAKENHIDLRNNELTSGGLGMGINAQPIPQARIELDYFSIPFTDGWWQWRLRGSYGMTTDAGWQKDFVKPYGKYTSNTFYHEKALYWKFGKEDHTRLSLTFEIGIQMFTQFGGKAYNVLGRDANALSDMQMDQSFSAFIDAITGAGRDATDAMESNSKGNTLGSYNMRLAWHGSTWQVGAYFERFFEDQSMMTLQYGISDHLVGLDATLPHNPFLSSLVVEHMSTRDQSGAVYHDASGSIPDKMNGRDNYYNHTIYTGWQHWGMTIGHPLITSPAYNDDHTIAFYNNRVKAWHIGLSGNPTSEFDWRFMITFSKNWGTYDVPFPNIRKQQHYMAEIGWRPQRVKVLQGCSCNLALAWDKGDLLGNTFGTQLTVRKTLKL